MRSKIIVTGANGQLGSELRELSETFPEYQFVFFSRADLAIDDETAVLNKFDEIKAAFCINCAAYTAVDKAENEQEQAFRVNGWSTGILAKACKESRVRLIHISTDYVFNGNATTPYLEDDKVEPVNLYGASKLKGEELAIENNSESIIIRTSWVYSSFGANFVKTMIKLMKDRENLGVVSDQHGTPTYAADLAMAIMHIISSGVWEPGIYHYSNEGIITWYDFAIAIRDITKSKCAVNPIATSQFPTIAKRPAYSVFNKGKIKAVYKFTIPDWKYSLETCIAKVAATAV